MKVKLIYRNYKPLHKIYESLISDPPRGVEYVIPPVKAKLNKLFPIYRKIRYVPLGPQAIKFAEKIAFTKDGKADDVDLFHYVNMISDNPPSKPYIVDIEHAASLTSFSPDPKRIKSVIKFLQNPDCKAVTCMSKAAQRTLKNLLGRNYTSIEHKVHVVYPALTKLKAGYKVSHIHIPKDLGTLQLLFVGNNAYVKGFDELLTSISQINNRFSTKAVLLHAITDDGIKIAQRHNLPNVKLYPPKFSKKEIFTQFYMPAEIFVMPTKQDTFGMAILDALNCGTPVLTTKQFAMPELVDDGVDGFLVTYKSPMMDSVVVPSKHDTELVTKENLNIEIVERLVHILTQIINKKVDLEKMGDNAISKFQPNGIFSTETRNKQIQKIYEDALSHQG